MVVNDIGGGGGTGRYGIGDGRDVNGGCMSGNGMGGGCMLLVGMNGKGMSIGDMPTIFGI